MPEAFGSILQTAPVDMYTTTALQPPEGNIILYRDQKAPNGMDGKHKITFSEISDEGFNWLGEWVTPDESISYPTWVIYFKKKIAD